MQRYALSNRQWKLIENLLPKNGNRGNQWKDHRSVINGMLWILRSGSPWRDLPENFGPWKTVYERFRHWTQSGLWEKVLDSLQAQQHENRKIDWRFFCIDGSVVRAHKAAAGAGKKTP